MMNWRTKKVNLNIGSIALENLTFTEDCFDVILDICDLSESLKAKIEESISIEKEKHLAELRKVYEEYPVITHRMGVWSDKPVVVDCQFLTVSLSNQKGISYCINTCFRDAENEHLEACAAAEIDLSGHEEELKKEILKALIDSFF